MKLKPSADIATKVAHVNSLIGAIGGNWDRVGMSNRLAAGLFHYDNNLPIREQVQSGLMREFEGFQDFLGYAYAQFNITAGTATWVDYFGGATFTTNENSRSRRGVSLGIHLTAEHSAPCTYLESDCRVSLARANLHPKILPMILFGRKGAPIDTLPAIFKNI